MQSVTYRVSIDMVCGFLTIKIQINSPHISSLRTLYLSELRIVGHDEDLLQAVGVVVPTALSNVHDDDFLLVGGAKQII